MKIHTTEEVRRFNAVLELADITLACGAADDVTCPLKLVSLLRISGHFDLGQALIDAAAPLGYFKKSETTDGIGAGDRGERPATGPGCNTESTLKTAIDVATNRPIV